MAKSGNSSVLQVIGLKNIKTTLTSLLINISAAVLCLQLSRVTDRREALGAMGFRSWVQQGRWALGQGHTGHWRGGRILNGDGHVAGVWQG